jgi:hypothetical protein
MLTATTGQLIVGPHSPRAAEVGLGVLVGGPAVGVRVGVALTVAVAVGVAVRVAVAV